MYGNRKNQWHQHYSKQLQLMSCEHLYIHKTCGPYGRTCVTDVNLHCQPAKTRSWPALAVCLLLSPAAVFDPSCNALPPNAWLYCALLL